jgi:hypothetical protein
MKLHSPIPGRFVWSPASASATAAQPASYRVLRVILESLRLSLRARFL